MSVQCSHPISFLRSLGASGAVHALTLGVLSAWGLSAIAAVGTTSSGEVREAQLAPFVPFVDPFDVAEESPSVDAEFTEPDLDAEADWVLEPADVPAENESFEDLLVPWPADLHWSVEPIVPAPAVTEVAVEENEATAEASAPVSPPDGVEVAALFLVGPEPAYPRLSIRRGEEGTVVCRLHVTDDGRVSAVDVVESSGHVRLDAAAVEALLQWTFRPRTKDDVAVADTVLHPVVFSLR